jgi:hypothetical protein
MAFSYCVATDEQGNLRFRMVRHAIFTSNHKKYFSEKFIVDNLNYNIYSPNRHDLEKDQIRP